MSSVPFALEQPNVYQSAQSSHAGQHFGGNSSQVESQVNPQHIHEAQYQNYGSGMLSEDQLWLTNFASSWGAQAPTLSQNMAQDPAQNLDGNQPQHFDSHLYATPTDLPHQTYGSLDQLSPAQVPQQLWRKPQQEPPQALQQHFAPASSQAPPSLNSVVGSSTLESNLDPALQALSQTAIPQEAVRQGNILQGLTVQQAIVPEVSEPQGAIPQVALSQEDYQQGIPQEPDAEEALQQLFWASFSQQDAIQAHLLEDIQVAPASHHAQEDFPQALQAHHQPQSQQRPQEPEPPLSFEQKMAAFRPVPEPHPNPVPRKGAGRKPKDQRFWPPQDASEDLRTRYLDLQQADENVNKADKKLAKNNDPYKTMHFQAMLLRNMTTRDKLWTECQRLEQGMAAVELSVEEAGSQAQKSHQSWTEMCDRLTARETSLKAENPFAVNEDGSIDLKLLGKESSGLQTMRNWRQHHWKELKDSFTALWNAMEVRYGADQDSSILRLQYVHALGCYPGFAQWLWPDDSQEAVYCRQQYSDPDPSTWYPVQPVQPAQDEIQHHEQDQPENGQQPEQAQGYEAPVAEQMQDWEAIPDVPLDPLNFQWYDPEAYALIQAFAQDNPVQQLQEEAVPVDVEMQDFQEITAAEYQAQRELSLQNQQPGDVQEQMAIDDWETDLTAHQHNADLDAEIESAFGILRQDQLTQQLQAQEAPVDEEIARVHEIAHPEPPAAQQESDPVHEKEVNPWFMGEQQAEAPEVESKDDEDVEMPDEEELDEEDGVEFENVTWQGVPLRELIERYEE